MIKRILKIVGLFSNLRINFVAIQTDLKKIFYILILLFFGVSCTHQQTLFSDKWTDTDLDGIPDYKDACPLEAGSPFNLGCPSDKNLSANYNRELSTDSDLDGIPDEKDECPYEYGSPFNMGCPMD